MNGHSEQFGVPNDPIPKAPLLHPKRIQQHAKKIRRHAKKIDNEKWIYGLYGALDGLSTSFSMLRYFFDAYYANSPFASADKLHDWSLTSEGIAFVVIESTLLVAFGFIGNMHEDGYDLHFSPVAEVTHLGRVNCYCWDDNKLYYIRSKGEHQELKGDFAEQIKRVKPSADSPNKIVNLSAKQVKKHITSKGNSPPDAPTPTNMGYIAASWPYARDVMKAMKNTNKGIRNALAFAKLMSIEINPGYLALAGIVLGIIAARNRTWLRAIREDRKKLQDHNARWLKHILDGKGTIFLHEFRAAQKKQPYWLYADLAAAFSGLVDAPYLYFGVMSLTVMTPATPFFFLVAASSLIFAAVCIITRIYEEYDFQRKLEISQIEVEIAINLKKYRVLCEAGKKEEREQQLDMASKACLESYAKWQKLSILSWQYLFIGGLKNGLDAYSALASLMFAIATIIQIFMIPYPPALLVGFIGVGLAFLLFFSILAINMPSLDEHASSLTGGKLTQKEIMLNDCFSLKGPEDIKQLDSERSKENIPTSQYFFQDWFETFRLFCSGGGKGIRSVDSIMVLWQTLGADGHYHDTDSMIVIAWLSAAIYAVIFALRGYARLGRGVDDDLPPKKTDEPLSDDSSAKESSQSLSQGFGFAFVSENNLFSLISPSRSESPSPSSSPSSPSGRGRASSVGSFFPTPHSVGTPPCAPTTDAPSDKMIRAETPTSDFDTTQGLRQRRYTS